MRVDFNQSKIPLVSLAQASQFEGGVQCELGDGIRQRVVESQRQLLNLIENRVPVYGVTTGFGDSSRRIIDSRFVETLQSNLVSYLLCGTGPLFSKSVSRAIMLCRMRSLSRGLSGVSWELIERMQMYLERDWIPAIPQEGSLGASGDLIPLAYIARAIRGQGQLMMNNGLVETAQVLKEAGVEPYTLKAKEGLALVNGTSAMAGLALMNLRDCRTLLELGTLATSWACLALNGKKDAFSELINSKAKSFAGQALVAKRVRLYLEEENFVEKPRAAGDLIQDRYSLRCAPQILGPVFDTLKMCEGWLEEEINGVSDNPVIDGNGEWAMGGNFYGGYMCHAMDYMKIGLAHLADMLDRQFITLIDEKTNQGLPPNLIDWTDIPEDQRFLHHGLKGLHQSTSAITSEVMNKSIPGGIFSRSSESHNQDKVSLGLSAGVQLASLIDQCFTITTLYLCGLAQALDIRGIRLNGHTSQQVHKMIRAHVPRVKVDQPLDKNIVSLSRALKDLDASWGQA